MEVKAGTLREWYDNKVKKIIKDNKDNNDTKYDRDLDDALHMLSKFLIQGIRAWGIFRNKGNSEHLSAVREVYETYKNCVYNPIFGPITHDDDKEFNIVHQGLVSSNRVMLKDMIDQMVNLYTGQTITYYPRSKSLVPFVKPSCPNTSTTSETVTFTDEAKEEFKKRMNDERTNGKDTQRGWMTEWCQVFTGIFGKKPYFARHDNTFTSYPNGLTQLSVGTIIQSGGKSTRRARTKKASRAKRRHTRRAARREYRTR